MPGIQPGAIDPRSGGRVRKYAFFQDGEVAAGTFLLSPGPINLQAGQRGLIVDAGVISDVASDATGNFDYAFFKKILAGNGFNSTVEKVAIPIQKALVRTYPLSSSALVDHRVSPAGISGTATAGGAATITLAAAQAGTDGSQFVNCLIRIIGGTGAGQSLRRIITYVQTTRVATVDANWDVQPDATSVYSIESQLGHTPDEPLRDVATAGGATTITLATRTAMNQDDYYLNSVITNLTTGEKRVITDYVAATKVATVASAWALGNPGAGTPYKIDHDTLIVRPKDMLYVTTSTIGAGVNGGDVFFYVDVLELSDVDNNSVN